MKTVYTTVGFALGASAALIPREQCCFGLTASGGVSGKVGQLGDGQNRIGQTGGLANQAGQYCLNNGQVTDGNGRGCILTPPTTQFQCDVGASPTGGFSVQNGNLAHDGNTQFYACPTGDNGGYNIYTQPVANQQGCVTVTLSTGGQCSGNGGSGSSSAPASSGPASSAPAPSGSAPAPSGSAPAPSGSAPAPSGSAPAPSGSAPAPSAPAPSGSAPAPSAPAPSAPAPSAPAPSGSAPAPSAPPGGPTQTIYSTIYHTITSCPNNGECGQATTVPGTGPAPSAPAPSGSAPGGSAPAPSGSAPGGSAPAPSGPGNSAPAPSGSAPAPSGSAPGPSAPAPSGSAPAPSAPSKSAPAPSGSAPAPSGTSPSKTGSACQNSLSGAYQTPHAIIPVNKNTPDKSYGTQYNAYLGGGNSTIFNFDIPQSYSGKQCSLIFLFPEQKDLETSSFTTSGSGSLSFSKLSSAAGLDVSYNSAPKAASQVGQVDGVKPGNSYVVASGACSAGTTQSYEVSASGDYKLSFFEDWNPSPIGVFITSC